jgi:hypothetical protein
MIYDKENFMFQDPNASVSLELIDVASQIEKRSTYRKPKSHGQGNDHFARLPEELRTEIMTWLPNNDVAALRLASRTMSGLKLSAAFWYTRLNAPELQMVPMRYIKKIGAAKKRKEDLIYSTLRLGLPRTRIARMAYEALWYIKVRSTARKYGVERPHWTWGSRRGIAQKTYCGLQTELIPFDPQWFSAVRFDNHAPFRSFKNMTMFFHSPRRHFHCSEFNDREADHDRHLTGIRFENGAHSKDLGHCQGQDTMQVVIPDNEWFDSMVLRVDTNNGVSVQSVSSTDGNVRREHDIYWSSLHRPFRARFEEITFSKCQEIEMGLTEECLVVVFDILVPDPDSPTTSKRKQRRLREYMPEQVKRLFRRWTQVLLKGAAEMNIGIERDFGCRIYWQI